MTKVNKKIINDITIDEKIAALREQLKQAKIAKQKQAAMQKKADAEKKRAEDTHKKVLLGAMLLNLLEKDSSPDQAIQKFIIEGLNAFLTRDVDRELFGLRVIQKSEEKQT